MRLARVLCVAGLALGTPLARAQGRFETNSGSGCNGKLLSNDGTPVEIETTDGARLKLASEQLTPLTQYRLELAKPTDEGPGRLDMANGCVGRKLCEQARIRFCVMTSSVRGRRSARAAPTLGLVRSLPKRRDPASVRHGPGERRQTRGLC